MTITNKDFKLINEVLVKHGITDVVVMDDIKKMFIKTSKKSKENNNINDIIKKSVCFIDLKSFIPMLQHICIKGGILSITDLDSYFYIKGVDQSDGIYDANHLKYGNFVVKNDLSVDDFSFINDPSDIGQSLKNEIKISYDQLKEIYPFISNQKERFCLCGVAIYDDTFTATDGHRLMTVNHNNNVSYIKSDIIPKDTIEKIIKTFKGGMFTFKIYENKAVITLDSNENIKIITKLIDGTYPDAGSIIENCIKNTDTIKKNTDTIKYDIDFKEAMKLRKGIKDKTVYIVFNPEGIVTIESLNKDFESIQIGTCESLNLNAFNFDYFNQVFSDVNEIKGLTDAPWFTNNDNKIKILNTMRY